MDTSTEPLSPAQAKELAQSFHDLGATIGQYRLDHVSVLSDSELFQLQNLMARCIQCSNTFITAGLFAAQDDLVATLAAIEEQTGIANQKIKFIADVDKVLQIATAAAILGASIASMNPSAIESGIRGLATSVAGPADPDAETA